MAHGQITTLLLLLLLLLSARQLSLAQQSNGTSKHTSSGQRALVAFSCIAFLVLVILLSICQRRGARPQPSTRRGTGAAPVQAVFSGRRRPRVGVGRDLVEAFPTAVYGDVKSKSGPLECAVCLAEFADSEELRVLPPCCHVFHPACIDPWLAAAVTCPLCRADLTSESSDMAGRQEVAVSVQGELHKEDCGFSLSVSAVRMHELTAAAPVHQHTLRLPEHVMKELAALRSHRRGQRTTSERT